MAAGTIVGSQIRQFIVITESFARMTRTDTAGNIYLLADDILPYLVDSLDVELSPVMAATSAIPEYM